MRSLIVVAALVAVSSAQFITPYSNYGLGYSGLGYSGLGLPAIGAPLAYSAYNPAVIPAVAPIAGVKSQYHAQDELGQASYGHAEPFQSHTAVQDAAGNKIGSFSYVDPTGHVQRTDYVADGLGYRVASNSLPVGPGAGPLPVVDTPEVVAARAAHLAAHIRARRSVAIGHTPAATAPLATAVVAPIAARAIAAPLAYSAPIAAPLAYSSHIASPLAYSSHIAAPLAYSAPIAAPLAYSAAVAAPLAYSAPIAAPAVAPVLSREATLTTVVNTPGHAVSYRVD